MYGRYGSDKLNAAIYLLWFILMIINLFVNNIFLYIFTGIPPIIAIWRMLSKNTYKRSRENQIFLKYFAKVKAGVTLQKNKIKHIKTHRYIKCPYCKATIRVPNKKGNHTVCCPKCHKDFKKFIF